MLSPCQLPSFTVRQRCTVTRSSVKQWSYLYRKLWTTTNHKATKNSYQELSIRRLQMPHTVVSDTKHSHPAKGSRCSHANLNVHNPAHSLFCSPLPLTNEDCNHYSYHGHENCNNQESSLDPSEVVFFLFHLFLSFFSLHILFMRFLYFYIKESEEPHTCN